jgi:hypothetical protein
LEEAALAVPTPALPLLLLLLLLDPCQAQQVQWLLLLVLVLPLPKLQSGRQVHHCRKLRHLQQRWHMHAQPWQMDSSTGLCLLLLLLLLQALLSCHSLAMQA